jgi:hypothetical protein
MLLLTIIEQEKFANLAKNTAIIMKFSSTLSAEHSRIKIKKNLKLHTSERY